MLEMPDSKTKKDDAYTKAKEEVGERSQELYGKNVEHGVWGNLDPTNFLVYHGRYLHYEYIRDFT